MQVALAQAEAALHQSQADLHQSQAALHQAAPKEAEPSHLTGHLSKSHRHKLGCGCFAWGLVSLDVACDLDREVNMRDVMKRDNTVLLFSHVPGSKTVCWKRQIRSFFFQQTSGI